MGFPAALFVETPDDEWICAICQDVLEDPVCTPCGHSFCSACLAEWLTDNEQCPTCRTEGLSLGDGDGNTGRNCCDQRAFKKFILKSKVSCAKFLKNSEGKAEEPASARRRLNNGKAADATSSTSCEWTGILDDWYKHRQEECQFSFTCCSVRGCDHTCIRKDLSKHMVEDIARHMELMVDEKTESLAQEYDQKLQEVKDQHLFELGEQRIISFCQQWIRHRPDALFDVCVYRPHRRYGDKRAPSLLVGIPGPLNTPWEGGLFPAVVELSSLDLAPRFKFPPGFHHVNVYPSGTISVFTLNEEAGWTTLHSIPELLFSVQQLLAHPNPDFPAQTRAYCSYTKDLDGYKERAREQAKFYSAADSDFLLTAKAAFGRAYNLDSMKLVDDERNKWNLEFPRYPALEVTPPSIPCLPEAKGGCGCSCRAWGSTFWDSRREMRFLFGTGG